MAKDDYSADVWAVAIIFSVLTWFTVPLRVYTRLVIVKSWWWDDWTLVFAQLTFTVYLVCQIGGCIFGTGKHASELSLADEKKALKFWFICELFYAQSTCWAKVSIGFMLLRIASIPWHRWILISLIVGSIVFCQVFFLVLIFQCLPQSLFWERADPTVDVRGRCINPKIVADVVYAGSAVNSAADWTFAVLPIFMVWKLQMTRQKKILVAGILAMGCIASVATLVRLPAVEGLERLDDFLYETSGISIWSTVEVGLGITAASVSCLRPLLRRVSTRFGYGSNEESNNEFKMRSASNRLSAPRPAKKPGRSWFVSLDGESEESVAPKLKSTTTATQISNMEEGGDGRREDHAQPIQQKLNDIWVAREVDVSSMRAGQEDAIATSKLASRNF